MNYDWTSYLWNTLGDNGNLPQTTSSYDLSRYTKQNRWYLGNGYIAIPPTQTLEMVLSIALNSSTPSGKANSNEYPTITFRLRDKTCYLGIYSEEVINTVSDSTYGFTRTVKIPMNAKVLEDPFDESIMLTLSEFFHKYKTSGDVIMVDFSCNINFSLR